MRLTIRDRVDAYAAAFPSRPALQIVREQNRDVMYGTWLGGQNYRAASAFYGGYPPKFIERVLALFPESHTDLLHAFSGSLPPGPYTRCDMAQPTEFQCRVEALPLLAGDRTWPLVMADPPYSKADAAIYGTPSVNRGRILAALARVTRPGGHLAWLDCVWPMHAKRDWLTVGRITLIRSTNHRVRLLSIFERVAL